MDEEPKLAREIAKTGLLVVKILLAIAVPYTLLFFAAMARYLACYWASFRFDVRVNDCWVWILQLSVEKEELGA